MNIKQLLEALDTYCEFKHLTGVPFYDKLMTRKTKGFSGQIMYLSPVQYIVECAERFNQPISEVVGSRMDDNFRNIVKRIQNGERLNMPYLHYGKEFKQDGLHRAMACRYLDIPNFPVLVVYEGENSDENLDDIVRRLNSEID